MVAALLLLVFRAWAHEGLVLPWDPDDIDYAQAGPDAWKALDLHVSVLGGIALFCWLYARAVTTWRVRYGWSDEPLEAWRAWSFGIAQVTLMLALNGPVHHLSDYYLFSAHMVQHLMLNLLWAPLTVLSLPPWLVEAALQVPSVRRLSDFFGDLRVKFLVYNGVLYFWHIPYMYDLALAVHEVHIVEHLGFMATSIIAWVGLLCGAPSLPRPSPLYQLLYLFVMTLPMKLLGAIITLADEPIYQGYLAAPRVFGLTPMQDQGWGGLLMWLPGGLALWASMIYVFARWVQTERNSAPVRPA
jgi:putative membrane protein